MGTKGREIVGVDIDKLLEKLNKALADEWLAYYQYWVGANVVTGALRTPVQAELMEHAGEEFKHANMLIERIIQLGGTPVLSPEEWYKLTNCGYEIPKNPEVEAILDQNIKGEQCAIEVYQNLLKFLEGKDFVSFNTVTEILEDEIEHEEDLENLKEDLATLK